jgi:uncharacterized protein YecA (UPF0149 family)
MIQQMNMNPTPPCDSVETHNQFHRQTPDTGKVTEEDTCPNMKA